MRKHQKKLFWFTLVELIIVITILAILATVAFISFQGYSKDSRDSNRLATINSIEKWLALYQVKTGTFPMPENYIDIKYDGDVIWYQWDFWENISRVISMNKTPSDPLDSVKYTYNLNKDWNMYQITSFFEKDSQVALLPRLISKTYASGIDYSQRIIRTFWNQLGALFISTGSNMNTPLHQLRNETTFTGIDIQSFVGILSDGTNIWNLKAVFNNNSQENKEWTWNVLWVLKSTYTQKISIITTKCENGWIEKWDFSAVDGGNTSMQMGHSYKICEWNNFSEELITISPNNCKNGGNSQMRVTDWGWNTIFLNHDYNICEGNIYSGIQVVMPWECSIWWVEKWEMIMTDGGWTKLTLNHDYKICEKQ